MKVGLCDGVFDLLHEGHLHFLTEARKRCKELHAAVNIDESVKRLKAEGRPIQSYEERAWNVLMTRLVAGVYAFDTEDDLRHIIAKRIRPNVIFKGSEYERKEVTGSGLARVIFIPMLPGWSTTSQIAKRRAVIDQMMVLGGEDK